MNHFIVAVVLCFTIFGSTFATDQHLICKSVDDVFSSDEQVHSARRLRGSVQGPPGKLGPKGDKGVIGQKGERGSEGIVDYSTINDRLEEMVTSATAALQAKVEKLENENLNITKQLNRLATAELQAKVEKLENEILNMTKELPREDFCTEGFIYLGKCYFVKLFQSSGPRSHGEQTCRENLGTMADIISLGQQTLVMEYMRRNIPDGWSRIQVWVAPKYELSTRTVRLSDGRFLSASTLRWYPSYPRSSGSYTGIALLVSTNASDSNQGIYNYLETNNRHGVLCEK